MSIGWNIIGAVLWAVIDEVSSPDDSFVDGAVEWLVGDVVWWAIAEGSDNWLLWLIAGIWAAALTDKVLDNNWMED